MSDLLTGGLGVGNELTCGLTGFLVLGAWSTDLLTGGLCTGSDLVFGLGGFAGSVFIPVGTIWEIGPFATQPHPTNFQSTAVSGVIVDIYYRDGTLNGPGSPRIEATAPGADPNSGVTDRRGIVALPIPDPAEFWYYRATYPPNAYSPGITNVVFGKIIQPE